MTAASDSGNAPWRRHLRPQLETLSVYDVPPARAVARLHANECPEPWDEDILGALAGVVRNLELNRYPDTSGRSLRRVLGQLHGCERDRVVLGNGSDEIISILLTALSGQPDSAVVIPDPTFIMYEHTARVLGLEVRKVPLDAELQLDADGMRAALDRGNAAVCFLARPNNPTSSLFDEGLIRSLIAEYPDTVFVIDEAYAAYAPGCSLWRSDNPDNQVHMSTLSKVGLAGIRLGYCIANADLALAMHKVRHPYNLSLTSLALAEAVLTRFRDAQAAMIERTIENRERLVSILNTIPGAHVYPAHANLALVRVGRDDDATRIRTHLADQSVLVKNVCGFTGLSGCLRVSVGTSAELDRLEQALATLPSGAPA